MIVLTCMCPHMLAEGLHIGTCKQSSDAVCRMYVCAYVGVYASLHLCKCHSLQVRVLLTRVHR